MRKIAAVSMAGLTLIVGQTPDSQKVEFEVASIRPAVQDNSRDISTDKGRFRTHNVTLRRLVARAYDIDIGQVVGGPAWVDSDGFDINAKIPEQFAQQTRAKVPAMIQGLLADRFQLVIHREPRQIAGYILVVAKNGPKMEHAKDQPGSSVDTHNTHLVAKNGTMEAFAGNLSRIAGRLVVDRTALPGGFNFELDWAPERLESNSDASSDTRPSIFTALQEQLGLKLESAKVPVSVIVIDGAERPGSN